MAPVAGRTRCGRKPWWDSGMKKKHVLLVGDYGHRDLAGAAGWLSDHCHVTRWASVTAALSWVQDGQLPDVIVLAQSHPGQLPEREIELLHAASPLSRLVALLGSWCEGETRSGRPWPGLHRVYWHQWIPRMSRELLDEDDSNHRLLPMPRTATANEQYERLAKTASSQRQGLIAIHTHAFRMYEALSDACAQAGLATVWFPPSRPAHSSGAAVAIWEGVSADEQETGVLEELVEQHSPAPVIALLDFLRHEDIDRLMALGASRVLAKPFLLNDLLWQLEQALDGMGQRRAVSRAA